MKKIGLVIGISLLTFLVINLISDKRWCDDLTNMNIETAPNEMMRKTSLKDTGFKDDSNRLYKCH